MSDAPLTYRASYDAADKVEALARERGFSADSADINDYYDDMEDDPRVKITRDFTQLKKAVRWIVSAANAGRMQYNHGTIQAGRVVALDSRCRDCRCEGFPVTQQWEVYADGTTSNWSIDFPCIIE